MSKEGKKKVAVAMSGGVDSGVAAALLVRAGYECAGFHMKLWQVLPVPGTETGMRSGRKEAREKAEKLGIPFYVVDLEKKFKKRVVDYFLAEYAAGRTPNPCVMCNKFIKFGELLEYVRKKGFDFLATGHYARVVGGCSVTNFSLMSASRDKNFPPKFRGASAQIRSKLSSRVPDGRSFYHLLAGCDKSKDQSYFLYNLTQKQLARVIFPVGNYTKDEVRKMARKWKLPVAKSRESQEICFLPEKDYRLFLKRQILGKIVPGEVVDTKGRVIGKHKGLPLYTIGQRHGFTVSSKCKVQSSKLIPPFYVFAKDAEKNRLIVGFGKETERKEFLVRDVNWVNPKTESEIRNQGLRCQVRIRHQGGLLKATILSDLSGISNLKPKRVRVILSSPERGIAPGQAAVFYLRRWQAGSLITDYEVLGGGIISD